MESTLKALYAVPAACAQAAALILDRFIERREWGRAPLKDDCPSCGFTPGTWCTGIHRMPTDEGAALVEGTTGSYCLVDADGRYAEGRTCSGHRYAVEDGILALPGDEPSATFRPTAIESAIANSIPLRMPQAQLREFTADFVRRVKSEFRQGTSFTSRNRAVAEFLGVADRLARSAAAASRRSACAP